MTSIDMAEDTPGLPNFLNRNHPNCKWRSDIKPGPKETALRANRETGPKPIIDARTGKPVTPETVGLTKADVMPAKTNGALTSVAKAIDDSKRVNNEPAAPAKPKETTVKTKQKKTPSTKARTRVKAGAKTKAAKTNGSVRPGSKLETIVGLLKRPEGCTTKDVLKATGWPAVSMPQQAKAAGLTLKKEKDGPVTRYRAA